MNPASGTDVDNPLLYFFYNKMAISLRNVAGNEEQLFLQSKTHVDTQRSGGRVGGVCVCLCV